ncbi:hypothetical protein BGZ67_000184 [Mortierella alpina]|nr:hypothetical protein BGZ67_000184 [Mortierella alpina]
MAQVLASAAFRGDVLFIHYSSHETPLGALYSVDTNAYQSPWSSRAAATPSSNRGIGSAVPFYHYTKQYILSAPGRNINNSIQSHTAVSMVSTSSSDSNLKSFSRHDLLLAFRSAQSGSSPMVRLVPKSPNDGSATQEGANSWWAMTEDDDSILSPTDSSHLWIASGGPSSGPEKQEGSIVYRLATTGSSTSVIAQTIDVSKKSTSARPGSNVLGSLLISSVKSSVTPKVLWLRGGGTYDAVVVGQCATTSQGTCLVFFNKQSQMTITTTTLEYDPNACLAADDGVIIMATWTQMWTLKYSPESLASPIGSWSTRPIKGLKSKSILACAAKNSIAYAVVEGLPFVPSLQTLDFGSEVDLSWETMEMFDGSGDNYDHGPGTSDINGGGGLYSRPGQQLPIIATSLSAAPYKPFVISSSPIITPNGSPNRAGDKGEVDQNEQTQDQTRSEAESSSGSNAVASTSGTSSNESSLSVTGPVLTTTMMPNTFYPQSAGEGSRSYRNSRPMHEMMSPTLANAQRILQQSQEHQRPR